MVRVHDHWDPIRRSDGACVGRPGDGAQRRGLLRVVREAFPCEEGGAALRELDDHRPIKRLACLENGVDSAGGRAIHRGDGEALSLGEAQQRPTQIAGDDAGLHAWDVPVAVELRYRRVEHFLRSIHADAVLIDEPCGLRGADHGRRAIVTPAAAPQGPEDHRRSARLRGGEHHALRRAEEVQADGDARLAAFVDGQDGLAAASRLNLRLVRVQAAHVAILAGAQEHQVHGGHAVVVRAHDMRGHALQ
mmetsp:Transcript_127609/g.369424  ORF Transcript_127609/g.369424 Transcript_127609/m.369424 type:complete len:248 (+) Transcript_127609:571-1314(+)